MWRRLRSASPMRVDRRDSGFCENSAGDRNALYGGDPMKIIVRNAPCTCGSGRKYKRCHELQMPKASLRGNEETKRRFCRQRPACCVSATTPVCRNYR